MERSTNIAYYLSEDCTLCKTQKFDIVLGPIIVFLSLDIVETEQNTHVHQKLKAKNACRQSAKEKERVKASGSGNNNESTLCSKGKELQQILLRIKWATFNVKCLIFYAMDLRRSRNKTELRGKNYSRRNQNEPKKSTGFPRIVEHFYLWVCSFFLPLATAKKTMEQAIHDWVNYMRKSTKLDEKKWKRCLVVHLPFTCSNMSKPKATIVGIRPSEWEC